MPDRNPYLPSDRKEDPQEGTTVDHRKSKRKFTQQKDAKNIRTPIPPQQDEDEEEQTEKNVGKDEEE